MVSSESKVLATAPRVTVDGGLLAIDGGSPVRREPWPTYDKGAVFVDPEDEESALRAIRSHLYFRYDYREPHETECGKFEAALCRYFGSKHALATSNGTTALAVAIMAARIPPGAVIACPGFGEAFVFRAPDAQWFARALRCAGIDARNLGCDQDSNVRVYWNWRFLFDGEEPEAIKAMLPNTTRYMREAGDVPLSSTLSAADCDELITAVRKVAGAMESGLRQPAP